MDFYERRQKAASTVDKMLQSFEMAIDINQIYLVVEAKTGLGKKFVDTRIATLKEMGVLVESDGKLWHKEFADTVEAARE